MVFWDHGFVLAALCSRCGRDRLVDNEPPKAKSERPSSSFKISGILLRTVATKELVVLKSIPTAKRCWCGAVDIPWFSNL